MLKLNASFSKKVPAEQDYSSKSYHAAIEVELPDGLTQEQLQEKIHGTFALVEKSVESEINGQSAIPAIPAIPAATQPTPQPVAQPTVSAPTQNRGDSARSFKKVDPASGKQLKYLCDIAAKVWGWSVQDIASHAGVDGIDELSRRKAA